MNANAKKALIAIAAVLTVVVMGFGYIAYRNHYTDGFNRGMRKGFNRGYNAGACQAEQDAIKQGYKSYLKVKNLGFTPTFTDGGNCKQVFVVLTKEVTPNGHTVKTTCKRAEIQLADAKHVTPYTTGVKCTTVDVSTNEVSVGQAVKPGG